MASSIPSDPLVLIVDDYPDALEVTALALHHAGFRVETASDGIEAIQQAVRLSPDVIVMDLSMPGVDGWEAIRQIKGFPRTRNISIIAVTALPDHWNRTKAEAAGCDGYLQKPCPPLSLATEIRSVLERSLLQSR